MGIIKTPVDHQRQLLSTSIGTYHPSLASWLGQGLGDQSILLWELLVGLYWFPLVLSVLLSYPWTALQRPSPASHFSQAEKWASRPLGCLAFFGAAGKSLSIAGWLGGFSQYQQQPRQKWLLDPGIVPSLCFSISRHWEFSASCYLCITLVIVFITDPDRGASVPYKWWVFL